MSKGRKISRSYQAPSTAWALLDNATELVANDLIYGLQNHYGNDIESIHLFGSRARGDFKRYSDMDIALAFRPDFNVDLGTLSVLLWITFKIMIRHGIYVQIRILQNRLDYLWPTIEQEGLTLFQGNSPQHNNVP